MMHQRPPFYGVPFINSPMGYQPIGKMTNSQDPKAKAARVFVGNLNTAVVKEQELISIFGKYGEIAGVSLMKGYGFVQFTNEYHARKAVNAEHGHVLGLQPIVKWVAEKGMTNPSVRSDHYCAIKIYQMHFAVGEGNAKLFTYDLRIANDPNPSRPKGFKRVNQQMGFQPFVDPKVLPVYPGSARPPYQQIHTPKLTHPPTKILLTGDEPANWTCAYCHIETASAWELMKHASISHQTQIYVPSQLPDYEQQNSTEHKPLQ